MQGTTNQTEAHVLRLTGTDGNLSASTDFQLNVLDKDAITKSASSNIGLFAGVSAGVLGGVITALVCVGLWRRYHHKPTPAPHPAQRPLPEVQSRVKAAADTGYLNMDEETYDYINEAKVRSDQPWNHVLYQVAAGAPVTEPSQSVKLIYAQPDQVLNAAVVEPQDSKRAYEEPNSLVDSNNAYIDPSTLVSLNAEEQTPQFAWDEFDRAPITSNKIAPQLN